MDNDRPLILIVDDNPGNIDLLVNILKKDYRMIAAKNGRTAIKYAETRLPDLILLDVIMPGINGYEVCTHLKADPGTKDIAVIFITAMTGTANITQGFESGAVDYITKPFNAAEVRARVQTHLALAKMRAELRNQNVILEQKVEEKTGELRKEIVYRREAEKALQDLNEKLEQRVEERTAELARANDENLSLNEQLNTELIRSEKMAALGQLIAGVAHEINTPLGVIRSSVDNVAGSLHQTLQELPRLFQLLPESLQSNFFVLLERAVQEETRVSAKQARKFRRKLTAELEKHDIDDADDIADTLTDMGIYGDIDLFLPLFRVPESQMILQTVYNLSAFQRSTRNIVTAADHAAKVVLALKSYAHYDHVGERIEFNLTEGIEMLLTLYNNQIKYGIEVVRNYEEIPPVLCYPDELNQVWTNLIHNAIQAMGETGRLEIDVRQEDGLAVVAITDSGKGIPDEIRDRIFEPFFTTKPSGEGSGLGLDIVKTIIDKHGGEIRVESEPGRTAFQVIIPIHPEVNDESTL